MNGPSGFEEVRSSISRLPSYRLLHEQQPRFGTGSWSFLLTHHLMALSAGISTKRENVRDTFSFSLKIPLNQKTKQHFICCLLLCLAASLSLLMTDYTLVFAQSVELKGVEVTQAIQSADYSDPWNTSTNNTVSLIARKKTVVRAYFDTTSLTALTITGTLNGSSPVGTVLAASPTSDNSLILKSPTAGFLPTSRSTLSGSLNFVLPSNWTNTGSELTLNVEINGLGSSLVTCSNCAGRSIKVRFVSAPPLRLRLVKLKYKSCVNGSTYEPTETDVALVKSWLHRAYPISDLDVIEPQPVDMPDQSFFPLSFNDTTTNTLLAAIRTAELMAGGDDLFRYVGLVSDPAEDDTVIARSAGSGCQCTTGFACDTNNITQTGMEFRGGAYGSDPILTNNVATSPVGPPGLHPHLQLDTRWDTDGSYGDWYSGHELGHLFGLKHLDFCGTPSPYDPSIFPNGQVSGSDEAFFGFDVGDSISLTTGTINISPNPLRGITWHDLMTYCQKVWVSADFYHRVLSQLNIENPPTADTTPPSAPVNLRLMQINNPNQEEQYATIARTRDETRQAQIILIHTPHSTRKIANPGAPSGRFLHLADSDTPPLTTDFPVEKSLIQLRYETLAKPVNNIQTGDFLSVIGTVNFTRKIGKIRFTSRVSRATARTQDLKSSILVRILQDIDPTIRDYPVFINHASDRKKGEDDIGLVDAIIPILPQGHIREVTLVLHENNGEKILASLSISQAKPQFSEDINFLPSESVLLTGRDPLQMSWRVNDPDTISDQLTYTVQISGDRGKTWQILTIGRTKPEFVIESAQIKAFRTMGLKELAIKVIASDGFNSDEKTTTFRLE